MTASPRPGHRSPRGHPPVSGSGPEAINLLEPASTAFDDLGPSERALVRLRGQLARAYMFAERWQSAVDAADRVLASAERLDAVDIVADVLITRGSALCKCGQPYSGMGAIQAGHDLALTHQLQATVLRALNNLTAYGGLADPRQALETALPGLAHARRAGERSMAAYLAANAIEVATDVGEWDLARREMDLALGDLSIEDPTTRYSWAPSSRSRRSRAHRRRTAWGALRTSIRAVVTERQGIRGTLRAVQGDLDGARIGPAGRGRGQ